jgi:hypothetical protein
MAAFSRAFGLPRRNSRYTAPQMRLALVSPIVLVSIASKPLIPAFQQYLTGLPSLPVGFTQTTGESKVVSLVRLRRRPDDFGRHAPDDRHLGGDNRPFPDPHT